MPNHNITNVTTSTLTTDNPTTNIANNNTTTFTNNTTLVTTNLQATDATTWSSVQLNSHLNAIHSNFFIEPLHNHESAHSTNNVSTNLDIVTPEISEPNSSSRDHHLCELFDYYQSVYAPPRDGIRCSTEFITAFQTKIFSGQLRQIAEFAIDEELQPVSDSMWKCFQDTFVVPEVHINGQRTYALIDTGASCSAMSFKFSQVEAITSLKLVFRKNTRILKLADNKEVHSEGLLENVPVTVNIQQTTANTQILNDLSYDLILGRDWCEANGVIIDFNKKKVYLLKPQARSRPFGLLNHLEDRKPTIKFDPTEYAHLTHKITIKPYHETLVPVRSKQNDSSPVFAKCYEPLGERFGIFAIKGVVQFKSNIGLIAVGNLTAKEITLPVGTIVAKIESFNENDYETHEWKSSSATEETTNPKVTATNRRFVVKEDMPNKTIHWKPIIKRRQTLRKQLSLDLIDIQAETGREVDPQTIAPLSDRPNDRALRIA